MDEDKGTVTVNLDSGDEVKFPNESIRQDLYTMLQRKDELKFIRTGEAYVKIGAELIFKNYFVRFPEGDNAWSEEKVK